ncbi:MAG: hypothetical protein RMK29_17445 [Myxococcales bacterium]|nr:hypothetical protein [Myxococcota bacterium]MDW8283496.1 hypothetical protein [Myxococcales bacterium]
MSHDQNDSPQLGPGESSDAQLRSLISLFNWLVGEVVTARVMVLRLAADLVRIGILPVEEINGMPLTQEIIDSVLSNFPTDPIWRSLGQRLRASLETLRQFDLYGDQGGDELDDTGVAADDYGDMEDDLDRASMHSDSDAQVLYSSPDHDTHLSNPMLTPRLSRPPRGRQN